VEATALFVVAAFLNGERIPSIALELATEFKINFRRNAASLRYRLVDASKSSTDREESIAAVHHDDWPAIDYS
jgi:hypothetical protein